MSRVKAGGAYIEISANIAKLQRGLYRASSGLTNFANTAKAVGASAQASINRVADSFQSVGNRLMAIGGIGTGLFTLGIKKSMDMADSLQKLSLEVGVSIQSLSELRYVAEQSSMGLSDVATMFTTINRNIADASIGRGRALPFLKELGINIDEISRMTPEDAFNKLAVAIMGVDNQFKRTRFANILLGDARWLAAIGTEIMVKRTKDDRKEKRSKDIEDTRDEANRLMATMTEKQANALVELGNSFTRLKEMVAGAGRAIVDALIPPIKNLVDMIVGQSDAIKKFFGNFGGLIALTGVASVALVGLGSVLSSIGVLLRPVALGFGLIGSAVSSLIALLPALMIGGTGLLKLFGGGLAVVGRMSKTIAGTVSTTAKGVYYAGKASAMGTRVSAATAQEDEITKQLSEIATKVVWYDDAISLAKASKAENLAKMEEEVVSLFKPSDDLLQKQEDLKLYKTQQAEAAKTAKELGKSLTFGAVLKTGAWVVVLEAIRQQAALTFDSIKVGAGNMKTAFSSAFATIKDIGVEAFTDIRDRFNEFKENFMMVNDIIKEKGLEEGLIALWAVASDIFIEISVTALLHTRDLISKLNGLWKGFALHFHESTIVPISVISQKIATIFTTLGTIVITVLTLAEVLMKSYDSMFRLISQSLDYLGNEIDYFVESSIVSLYGMLERVYYQVRKLFSKENKAEWDVKINQSYADDKKEKAEIEKKRDKYREENKGFRFWEKGIMTKSAFGIKELKGLVESWKTIGKDINTALGMDDEYYKQLLAAGDKYKTSDIFDGLDDFIVALEESGKVTRDKIAKMKKDLSVAQLWSMLDEVDDAADKEWERLTSKGKDPFDLSQQSQVRDTLIGSFRAADFSQVSMGWNTEEKILEESKKQVEEQKKTNELLGGIARKQANNTMVWG